MDELNFSQQMDKSFKNIIGFFNQLALLLKDCDRLMGEDGYTTITGNTSVYEMSKSLLNPEDWVPSYIGRTYVKEEGFEDNSFTDIKFINIFLRYGSGGTHDVQHDDPLIIAGMMKIANPENFKFESWQTKSWFWNELDYDKSYYEKSNCDVYHTWKNVDAKADGTIKIHHPANHKWWKNIQEIQTFAYPLENIKNSAALKEKIIDELINMDE